MGGFCHGKMGKRPIPSNWSREFNKRTGSNTGAGSRPSHAEYEAMLTAKELAERREHILEERRRTTAKWQTKIPEVRRVTNFEAFKNRFHELGEPDYAVEVLYATPNLQAQIRHEQTSRRKEDQARTRTKYSAMIGGYAGSEYGFQLSSARRSKKARGEEAGVRCDSKFNINAGQLQDAYMQRVRIQ